MPEKEFITGIAGVKVFDIYETPFSFLVRGSALVPEDTACPRCRCKSYRTKATCVRVFKHAILGQRFVVLKLRIPKLVCHQCKRYFMVRIPGILPKKRSTEQFRQEVFHQHQGGLTQKHLSRTHGISGSTVERWYQDFVAYRVKELQGRACPPVLGIDEHFFTRKKGYATTFVDLKNHKVFDVVLGRSETSLRSFLSKLSGRDRVRVVVMDLSETYRSIVRQYFPNAMIVTDRFHVIRLLNQQFLKIWQKLDPEGRKNRGLISLMRRHSWNLKPEQLPKLEKYFSEIPGLKEVYDFKQDLAKILLKKRLTRREARDLIPEFLWHMNDSGVPACSACPDPCTAAT